MLKIQGKFNEFWSETKNNTVQCDTERLYLTMTTAEKRDLLLNFSFAWRVNKQLVLIGWKEKQQQNDTKQNM